jgi:hypothetical protein
MKLSQLAIPKDVQRHAPRKKEPTPFEIRRAACKTHQDLVDMGYAEGMAHPEAWADHVWTMRRHK